MAKYYQHVNPTDESTFRKVTKLLYVDDTDPDMTIYHFDDGTKCSGEFIGVVDGANPIETKKFMIEVGNTNALWQFKMREVNMVEQKATAKDGVTYDIPDPYFVDSHGHGNVSLSSDNDSGFGAGKVAQGVKYEAIAPRPTHVPVEKVDGYYVSYIKYALENGADVPEDAYVDYLMADKPRQKQKASGVKRITDFNAAVKKSRAVEVDNSVEPAILEKTEDQAGSDTAADEGIETPIQSACLPTPATAAPLTTYIDLDQLIKNNEELNLAYNGRTCTINAETVERLARLQSDDTTAQEECLYTGDKDSSEYVLINNMIDMSNKDECAIDMELVLQLPPADVYRLIKQVYPAGMADIFVNMIANSMSVSSLKSAVAEGLKNYYSAAIGEVL